MSAMSDLDAELRDRQARNVTLTVATVEWMRQHIPARRWPTDMVARAHRVTGSRSECDAVHEGVTHERWLKELDHDRLMNAYQIADEALLIEQLVPSLANAEAIFDSEMSDFEVEQMLETVRGARMGLEM